MPTVWVLQHSFCETLGIIADALEPAGIAVQYIRAFAGERIPSGMGEASGLVVMGGPMGVYESSHYPFLLDEMHLIERALQAGKAVLGVCLGSQLLAAALGACVRPGRQKEIGWHPIFLTDSAAEDRLWRGVESPFTAFHWHGDTFKLPRGATWLASSNVTAYQAFHYGECAYGLLFHLEVTQPMIQTMAQVFSDELRDAQIDGSELVGKAPEHLPRLRRIGGLVFQRWARLLGAAPR